MTTARKNYTTGKKTLKEVEIYNLYVTLLKCGVSPPAPTAKDMQDERVDSTF